MAKISNNILTPTTRDMTQAQISADQDAVKEWLAKNSPVIIDSNGAWHRDGVVVKKADLPQVEPVSLWGW